MAYSITCAFYILGPTWLNSAAMKAVTSAGSNRKHQMVLKCLCGSACRGVKKYGGEVKLNAHVDQVMMERGRATGVLLKSGQVIKARKVCECQFQQNT